MLIWSLVNLKYLSSFCSNAHLMSFVRKGDMDSYRAILDEDEGVGEIEINFHGIFLDAMQNNIRQFQSVQSLDVEQSMRTQLGQSSSTDFDAVQVLCSHEGPLAKF